MSASPSTTARDPSALQAELTAALSRVVFDDVLFWEHEDIILYECDGLAVHRQVPLAIVLPGTEAQIVEILRTRHRMDVPVVPCGVGTGLSGGAMPTPGGLVLSLVKFKRIIKVDPHTWTVVVQLGVYNLAISRATNSYGLYYVLDPSPQITCIIDGNVNENSGGVYCLKYGLTIHSMLHVRAVMMDGGVVEFDSEASDIPDFDLLATVIGPEDILVVVAEMTIRLVLKPQLAQMTMASFDDVKSGGSAVADAIVANIIPAGLEMTGKPATAAVEESVCAGYDLDAAAILLCESNGMPEEVVEEIACMGEVLHASGATHVQVSRNEAECLRSWNGRKNAFPTVGRISPDYYCMDGTTPREYIDALLRHIQQMEQKYALRCISVFHAGDGNMRPFILFNGKDQGERCRTELFSFDIPKACVELGNTVAGEHGVDVEKSSSMCVQLSAEECDALLRVKTAFDPMRLLSLDKAILMLARCAEYDKLYVCNGLLPHPDLPRF